MTNEKAKTLIEKITNRGVSNLERCSVGLANYVFAVTFDNEEKLILRCSTEKNAYDASVCWLKKLSEINVPVPQVLKSGEYNQYSYMLISFIHGEDLCNVYSQLTDNQKKELAKDLISIQRKVARLERNVPCDWTWNNFIDEMISRSSERISQNGYFDLAKVQMLKVLRTELQDYFDSVKPVPFLDDVSTKNVMIHNGKLSGVIDIDYMEYGDVLSVVALTRIALLNMNLDTKYIDYLLAELNPSQIEMKAFKFYSLLFCVDFMGERGMQFLDKVVPVDEQIISRLNRIFDDLLNEYCLVE